MLHRLYDKFRLVLRRGETSPLDNLDAAHAWVSSMAALPDYEAHQEVLAMLEKFNRHKRIFDDQRLHILSLIEHAGSKLQQLLIARFLKSQADINHADNSFWPEITAFYAQLAEAYQHISLSEASLQKLAPSLPIMVLRALHYQGKLIQWRYLRYELPGPEDWEVLHKLYQLSEKRGFAERSLVLKGSAYCTCQSIYTRVLLMHLMRPVGLAPKELELVAYWTWKWRDTIRLNNRLDALAHTHFVIPADNMPPLSVAALPIGGGSAYYWSVSEMLDRLMELSRNLKPAADQIKLYGVLYTADKLALIKHICAQLTRIHAQNMDETSLEPKQIRVSWGEKTVIAELANIVNRNPAAAGCQLIGHPDENHYRLHVPVIGMPSKTATNDLLISYNQEINQANTLSAIRWVENTNHAALAMGIEKIGTQPRLVTFHVVTDCTLPSFFSQTDREGKYIAIAVHQPDALISFHAIQERYLDMREGDYIYRIRLQEILEQTRNWIRIQFTLLTRSYQPRQQLS